MLGHHCPHTSAYKHCMSTVWCFGSSEALHAHCGVAYVHNTCEYSGTSVIQHLDNPKP